MSDSKISGHEEQLPESLQALAQNLDGAGPAVPLADGDAVRLIAAALKERGKVAVWSGGHARRGRAMAVAVLVLLGSSAAAAWYQHRTAVRDGELARAAASRASQESRRARAQSTVPQVQTEIAADSEIVPDDSELRDEAPVVRAPALNAPAEDLLQKANRLRREGQPKEAEQTYLQVVQREPQSMSAYVARVAVAELRLGRNPSSAIELLQAALQRFPSGPLEIEIRQALAQAYRATGNSALETSELTRLITRHPGTPAADRARMRLRELGSK